jgi:hypothetical protein
MGNEPHGRIRQIQPVLRERQAVAVREAPNTASIWEQVWERPWLAFAVIAILPGLVLSLIGPFGSYSAPLGMRFAFWMPTMAIGACLGAALSMAGERLSIFCGRPALRAVAITTAMTIAMTGVVWGMGYLTFGPGRVPFGLTFVFYVWLITVVIAMISAVLRARSTRIAYAAAPVAIDAPPAPASLAARLPAKLKNATILGLQAEDHYVRVHTDAGSDLILMRLADAIAEMGTTPGARTHRSWWAAKSAVKSIRRANGRIALVLTNETEVPISRGYMSELREAGWLTERESETR